MQHLFSKLIAGGLSAAVVLLWWPLVFPSDTVESWLVRGVIWTLSFELMAHAFMPLEEALWRSRAARRVRDRAAQAGGRIVADSPRGRTAVAGIALLVPLALLATAPAHQLGPKPARQKVREVTQVKRIVRVETKRVRVPQPMASANVPSAVAATPARAGVLVPRRAPAGSEPRRSPGRSTTPTPPRSAQPEVPTPDATATQSPVPDATATAPK